MTGRRRFLGITGWFIIFLFLSLSFCPIGDAAERRFRNVIVMTPDGCGSAHITVARWYKGAPLALDRMALGGLRTYGADSLITDSAPAATAFATGYKSSDKFIGILPDSVTIPGAPPIREDRKYKPVPSVLEGARLAGKSVGLIATSNIQHATPAAFSAHWPDRSDYNEIGKQQVYQGMDVVLGGGKKYLLPKEKGGTRTDGEDLVEALLARGYAFVETREDMMKVKGKKVWGAFADDAMAYDFDRKSQRPLEPSLAEMTKKAIGILSKNPKGFFLFVEGSKVDWASHAHDPVGVISDALAFDDAVGVALDYAKEDGQTLVLAFTDHGNGGMSIGSASTDRGYSSLSFQAVFGLLRKAALTGEGVGQKLIGNFSDEKITATVAEFYGINDLSAEEIKTIRDAGKRPGEALGPIMSARSHIGWTTRGHTGEDVFLYHYGYRRPLRMMENTDIARMVARALGVDLDRADDRLFAPAGEVFKDLKADVSIDRTDTGKATLVIRKGDVRARFPLGTNLMYLTPSGKRYEMEGISVLAPKTARVYLPRQASALFERALKP
jgi:alkaline phosphatase